jgi:multimeric flavodoxin WrbA/putative sterol carrier protein
MKVLALNSSARPTGQSKTEMVLTSLVKGMREAGAEVEVVNLRQKKINYCIGCYTCWTKTPGVCVHKDDMALELFPKWLESDIVVYATPLFHFTVNAQMKAFIERTLPVLLPYLDRKNFNEGTIHPLRSKHPAHVFVSVAGFPDKSVFDALSYWAKFLSRRANNLLAEIYVPGAEALAHHWKRDEVLAAVEQAGKEIITRKEVSAETMGKITQQYIDPDEMAAIANASWQVMIDNKMTPAEADRTHINPRPDSIESFMTILSMGFNPKKAKGKKGTLQFEFTGDKPGSCFFNIDENNCIPHEGRTEKPDCTVTTPFEVWADIIEGKAEGSKMFMEGKYTAQGNFSMMMVFGK